MVLRLMLLLCIGLIVTMAESVQESQVCTESVQEGQMKKFLGANWKCSLETTQEVDKLCDDLNQMWGSLSRVETDKVELCVNPPFVFLDRVRSRLTKEISVGSQNAFDARGPNAGNTGTTTTKMLRAVGCDWVLLGHSDRRNNLGETDELISDKVNKALEAGMGVTLTIGELLNQRREGLADATLQKQLGAAMDAIKPDDWHRIVVAYEPVWAVGEGASPCSPIEAQRINAELRKFITKRVSADAAAACRLTYTGSVNDENAMAYASLEDVDGFVVGRAGLDMTKLRSIIQTLARDGGDSRL
jgi:triosephosphate isomerase